MNKRRAALSVCFSVLSALAATTSAQSMPGDLDPSFGTGGIVTTHVIDFSKQTNDVKVQPDGKIVVGAYVTYNGPTGADFIVARYNTDGSLDQTFDGDGIAIISLAEYDNERAMTLQPDGKILVAGYYLGPGTFGVELARLNTDGSLDGTFDGDGKVLNLLDHQVSVRALAVQPDGKILVTGGLSDGSHLDTFIYRYNPDGSFDSSFDGDGKLVIAVGAGDDNGDGIIVQPDGKIVIGGNESGLVFNYDFYALRLNGDGPVDPTFGTNGIVTTAIGPAVDVVNGVARQADGKIVLTGYYFDGSNDHFATVRYNVDGLLDTSFGSGGKVTTSVDINDEARAVQIQPDNKLLIFGTAEHPTINHPALVRYNPDGTLDTTFSGDGKVITGFGGMNEQGTGVALQRDGRIVVAAYSRIGSYDDLAVARYLNDSFPLGTRTSFDYDGDGRSDISIFRPSNGAWYLQRSSAGLYGAEFGYGADKIAPADYDGDRKTDIAVYRPETGIWYVFRSSDGTVEYHVFGLAEDLPTPADYDGDGKADISVFRPSTATWYRQNSSDGSFYAIQFGASEDKPTIGDFDGDGKSDIAIFRPSVGDWYQLYSSDGSVHGQRFGFGTDIIVPADYDGDGHCDIAVFRPSTGLWYIMSSLNGQVVYAVFGLDGDIPAPGDFDGDGKADVSVFRPSDGTWYRTNSSDGSFFAYPFGANGDRPTQTAFTY